MLAIPEKIRTNIFKAVKSGYTYQEAGNKFNVSPSTIYTWVRAKRLANGTTKTTVKGKKTITKKRGK